MADTQITFRLDTVIRDEIARLIEGKKYRNQTDFIVRAIREKLEREKIDPDQEMKERLVDAIRSDPDVRAAFDQAWKDARDRAS